MEKPLLLGVDVYKRQATSSITQSISLAYVFPKLTSSSMVKTGIVIFSVNFFAKEASLLMTCLLYTSMVHIEAAVAAENHNLAVSEGDGLVIFYKVDLRNDHIGVAVGCHEIVNGILSLASGELHGENSGIPIAIALSSDGQKLMVSMIDLNGGNVKTTISFLSLIHI